MRQNEGGREKYRDGTKEKGDERIEKRERMSVKKKK